jgi:hypothetical protein
MKDSSVDNVYYDITIYNNGEVPFLRAVYEANKTQPILKRASDYYLTIARATIPLNTIPLLVCPIIPNQANPNLTPLQIGIRNNTTGINYMQNLIFTPELVVEPVPVQNQLTQVITEYYYVYSYTTFIKMANNALAAAFTTFIAANPGAPQAGFPVPFFIYNPITELISLIAHNVWEFDIDANPLLANTVVMNNLLLNYFDGFKSKDIIGPPSSVFSFLDVIAIYNNGRNGYPTNIYPAVPTYVEMSQDYPTTSTWISLRKILITSTSLPCPGEGLPTPGRSNDEYNSFPIIADFDPQLSTASSNGEVMYYDPQIYRLVDMMYDSPLSKINLRIYWGDKIGNIYPLTISAFNSVSIKILFMKKYLESNKL